MRYINITGSIMICLIIGSCGSEQSESTTKSQTDYSTPVTDTSEVYKRAKEVFYSLPSPLELSAILKKADGQFRKDLLHDPKKANIYQSTQNRAMALGVYGADLGYSTVYGEQGDALKFLAASKRIGETIGIQEAFSAETIERANANLDNRDSMMAIMSDMYWLTNSQLKEENRDQIALMVIAGGWAEGLFIGCNVHEESDSKTNVMKRMAEQKYASSQLQEMFKQLDDDYMINEVGEMFAPVFNFFSNLEIEEGEKSITKNSQDGSHTIGGANNIEMTPQKFQELKSIATELRTKIVEP